MTTWLCVAANPDWRWLTQREDSPLVQKLADFPSGSFSVLVNRDERQFKLLPQYFLNKNLVDLIQVFINPC